MSTLNRRIFLSASAATQELELVLSSALPK
jgi:hypothetical protein